ncbi:peptidyl-dipeptidase Dcp [Rhizobium albus]|nr:peptidyl-dipeptidase Dcp [Rhizobium albus]
MTAASPIAFERISDWSGSYGLPNFAAVEDDDFRPAFDAALSAHDAEIEAIAQSEAAPTFENTIEALELAGKGLSRVSALFFNRAGSHTNPAIQELEREIAPQLSRHYSRIAMNKPLFQRIDTLFRRASTLDLTTEQFRVLERSWKGFVRSGANLAEEDQTRLAAINERLATLGARFGQNVLADEQSWQLLLDETDLDGLPDFVRDAMASAASDRGADGRYAVTLSRSIIEPFLTFSERRDLREAAFRAWTARGENAGDTDNRPLIAEILKLRAEKAKLLGYENFAAYKLEDTMAKTPDAVNALLQTVWEPAVRHAADEEAALADIAAAEGNNEPIAPWDWRHYAEKLRRQRFDFSEEELKPYFQLDRIAEAAFDVAGRLFGLDFELLDGVKAYHPDVRTFAVKNRSGETIGIFLTDYFARSSKRSGAWMSAFASQHRLDGGQLPLIYNVMNFAKPREGSPALLSLDDARTLFHEFGHALHGLLSDVTYPSVSGTSVSRDFVELPSQLYEHWLTVPEILRKHAVHYRTGEPIPQQLLDKVLAAARFNAGFATVEYTASALIDMAYHTAADVEDPAAFEAANLEAIGKPAAIEMRHRSPHFLHIFSGDGYSAGYYSYMWSEVLDADAFSAFAETGDAFDAAMAERLRTHVYSAGGAVDPEETYTAFRGRLPTPEALLKKRGLVQDAA